MTELINIDSSLEMLGNELMGIREQLTRLADQGERIASGFHKTNQGHTYLAVDPHWDIDPELNGERPHPDPAADELAKRVDLTIQRLNLGMKKEAAKQELQSALARYREAK